jgi:hypothetical protein
MTNYNKLSVDNAIQRDPSIGTAEAKAIHSLLKGRERKPERVSRPHAVEILADHGWTPTSPTAWWPDGTAVCKSSFDDEMGVKAWYLATDVRAWLGY